MSFGRNPHVAKAEAAELKAHSARDATAWEHAWREAGRLWERAAEREADAKRRGLYNANAERARASADEPHEPGEPGAAADSNGSLAGVVPEAVDPDPADVNPAGASDPTIN